MMFPTVMRHEAAAADIPHRPAFRWPAPWPYGSAVAALREAGPHGHAGATVLFQRQGGFDAESHDPLPDIVDTWAGLTLTRRLDTGRGGFVGAAFALLHRDRIAKTGDLWIDDRS